MRNTLAIRCSCFSALIGSFASGDLPPHPRLASFLFLDRQVDVTRGAILEFENAASTGPAPIGRNCSHAPGSVGPFGQPPLDPPLVPGTSRHRLNRPLQPTRPSMQGPPRLSSGAGATRFVKLGADARDRSSTTAGEYALRLESDSSGGALDPQSGTSLCRVSVPRDIYPRTPCENPALRPRQHTREGHSRHPASNGWLARGRPLAAICSDRSRSELARTAAGTAPCTHVRR